MSWQVLCEVLARQLSVQVEQFPESEVEKFLLKVFPGKKLLVSHLINVENVISWQLPLAHSANHDVAECREVLLADGNIGICRLNVHVDLENLCNRLLHLHEPLLADVVHRVFIAFDNIANAISTIEAVLILLSAVAAVLKMSWARKPFGFIRRAVCTSIYMTETRIAQAAVFCKLFFTCWRDENYKFCRTNASLYL